MNHIELLLSENRKLRQALADAIPWIGHPAAWDANGRNREMCERAFAEACAIVEQNDLPDVTVSN